MSPEGAQQAEQKKGPHRARKLRDVPGLTTAIVAFVLVVLLGSGGVAIAMWNQSATATIAITAGASPKPSPTPTPSAPPTTSPPTTPPPAGPGIISTVFTIAPRPGTVNPGSIGCVVNGNSGNFTITWDPVPTSGVKYAVSLKSLAPTPAFQAAPPNVTSPTANFNLDGKAQGKYLLRIQAMNGAIAGEPTYRTLRHGGKDSSGCDWGASDGQPPLGAFSVNASPANQSVIANANLNPNANQINLSWTASQATSYVVSVQSTAATSSYGAEFTSTTLGATLTFPLRAIQNSQPAASAAFYGQYIVRVIPMNGLLAGDPVYKKVQYQQWSTEVWDFAIG